MKLQKDFPLVIKISFHKVIEYYQEQVKAKTGTGSISHEYMEKTLDYLADFPKLSEGIETIDELEQHQEPIRILLKDLFPGILSRNEIKSVSLPFHNLVFNQSAKLQEILKKAGDDFHLSMRNLDQDMEYIFACILILNFYYGYKIDFSRPLYYDIPDENGILRHYRIDQNMDFLEIFPTKKTREISEEDVDLLIQNMEDIDLWKEMFPPQSWIFKGFTIKNLTDVTVDDAISKLKSTLLYRNISYKEELEKFEEIFQSIYKIPDLRVGFTIFNERDSSFERMISASSSFILNSEKENDCRAAICADSYTALVKEHSKFPISNVEAYSRKTSENQLSKNLVEKGIKSAILAPIATSQKLLGVLELVSFKKNELNSINATKLDDILPYIVTAVDRNKSEYENRIKAVIQRECTSIHPSVLWLFEEEARNFIRDLDADGLASFKDMVFENVYPLYGQIDIVASSEARNEAIQKDLLSQLDVIENIIDRAHKVEKLNIYKQVKFRITEFRRDLEENLNASSEQKVQNLLEREVDPLIEHCNKINPVLGKMVGEYREQVNSKTGIIYNHRKDYDESVQQVNRTMARYIDRSQMEAQKIYPHYFERYKTDGVDHNIYIGDSLTSTREKPFDKVYLYDLRLWQLSTMCEMENRFYKIQESMPLSLEAASLILVFSTPLSIRYRMDEKRFDVDGTYNARYEIIKKRIDKACIKGSEERIAQKGKIAIIYSQRSDEREYLRYIKYLQSKNYLGEKVELVELEDVQGVIGLKAIRVEVLYSLEDKDPEEVITYEDLMKVLN